jgi:hypothetical protein
LKGINARGHHQWKSKIFGGPKTSYQLTIDFEKLLELEKLRHKLPNATKADLLERQMLPPS